MSRTAAAVVGGGFGAALVASACTTTEQVSIELEPSLTAFGLRARPADGDDPGAAGSPARAVAEGDLRSQVRELPSLAPGELPQPSEVRAPVALTSERLDLDSGEVRSVGVDSDGYFDVPGRTEIGWYRFGPSPGEPGSAVLAAHIVLDGRDGVFRHLERLKSGDVITVHYDDDSTTDFEIQGLAQYDKDVVPLARLFERDGPPRLILITCGGDFNPQLRSFDDNLIAVATALV